VGNPEFTNLVDADLDQLVSTVEAANIVGVEPTTIRQWKTRHILEPSGLDKYKRPLYRLLDVMQAEQKTRRSMIERASRSRRPVSA
jgi:DNA-binding transcriptional MerR regulator